MKLPTLGNLSARQTAISVVAGMAGALVVGGGGYAVIHNASSKGPAAVVTFDLPTPTPTPAAVTPTPVASTPTPASGPQTTPVSGGAAPVQATPVPTAVPQPTPCVDSPQPSGPSQTLFSQNGTGTYSGTVQSPAPDACGKAWLYISQSVTPSSCTPDTQWWIGNGSSEFDGNQNMIGGEIQPDSGQWEDWKSGTFHVEVTSVPQNSPSECNWTITVRS